VEKAQQRLYFIKMLGKAGVSTCPLTQAYRGPLESILTSGITVWYGNTTQAERKALQRVIKTAGRVIRTDLQQLAMILISNLIFKSLGQHMLNDETEVELCENAALHLVCR